MADQSRYREAVVVFLDVEACDEADALSVAESVVKAALRGDASRVVVDTTSRTIDVTADLRGAEITGRIVAAEHLAIAMGRRHLRVEAAGGPWAVLDVGVSG